MARSRQAGAAGRSAEGERIDALRRYRILDTPEEEPFDRVAMLARDLFQAPIALVSFIDTTRQWFKARVGLSVRQTPRAWAFCEHTIAVAPGETFVVTDARTDPRFAANPLVTGEPFIRFYAAHPIRSPDGFALGTVCVISDEPRPQGISAAEERWLGTLAGLASDELELRLQARRAQEAAAAEARLRRAQQAAGVTAFEANSETAPPGETAEAALRALLGLAGTPRLALRGVPLVPVPQERARLTALADRLGTEGGTLSEEFRLQTAEEGVLWAQLRGEVSPGRPDDASAWRIAGLLRDVTERRAAEERQKLLTMELDHRARNALAVVLAAVRLTPSRDPRLYAAAVEGRVAALARAHTLLTSTHWAGADLGDLLRGELKPFLGEGANGSRARIEGPPVLLAAHAAQPLSMAVHELATNAVKHGALASSAGSVSVSWSLPADSPMLRLTWEERGGPGVPAPPQHKGFGSRVLRGTVMDQLGGTLTLTWPRSGLVCTIEVPRQRVLARPLAS